MVRGRVVGRDYEPDRIWSKTRTVQSVDVTNFGSQAILHQSLEGIFNRDLHLRNLGRTGRAQVIAEAMKDWQAVPVTVRLTPLLAMRERGMISGSEYTRYAQEMGYTAGSAEYQYRKWTGTESSIWDMHKKELLRYGEYSKLIRAKGLTRGQAYYRRKKYQAQTYGIPFRGFEKKPTKPRSRRKTLG